MHQNTAFLHIYVHSSVLTEVLSELLPPPFMVIIDRVMVCRSDDYDVFPIRKSLPFPALIYTYRHSKLYDLPWKKPAPNKFSYVWGKLRLTKNQQSIQEPGGTPKKRVPQIPAKSCTQYNLNDAMVGQGMCHVPGPWKKCLPDKSHQCNLIEVLMLARCQIQCPFGRCYPIQGLQPLVKWKGPQEVLLTLQGSFWHLPIFKVRKL